MPQARHIAIAKPVPPIVSMAPVLAPPRLNFKLARVRAKFQITAAKEQFLIACRGTNAPASIPVGGVEPIIKAVIEPIHAMLRISRKEPLTVRGLQRRSPRGGY